MPVFADFDGIIISHMHTTTQYLLCPVHPAMMPSHGTYLAYQQDSAMGTVRGGSTSRGHSSHGQPDKRSAVTGGTCLLRLEIEGEVL